MPEAMSDRRSLMKPVRTFASQLALGEQAEQVLDDWMRHRGFSLVPAEMPDQRRGIDRFATGPDGATRTVEYKADSQGHRTGRAFVESISVDATGKPGWLWTTEADWLIYWTAGDGKGRVLSPTILRSHAHGWTRQYPVKTATNPTYHSYGVLVPLEELDRVALEVFTWPQEQ